MKIRKRLEESNLLSCCSRWRSFGNALLGVYCLWWEIGSRWRMRNYICIYERSSWWDMRYEGWGGRVVLMLGGDIFIDQACSAQIYVHLNFWLFKRDVLSSVCTYDWKETHSSFILHTSSAKWINFYHSNHFQYHSSTSIYTSRPLCQFLICLIHKCVAWTLQHRLKHNLLCITINPDQLHFSSDENLLTIEPFFLTTRQVIGTIIWESERSMRVANFYFALTARLWIPQCYSDVIEPQRRGLSLLILSAKTSKDRSVLVFFFDPWLIIHHSHNEVIVTLSRDWNWASWTPMMYAASGDSRTSSYKTLCF